MVDRLTGSARVSDATSAVRKCARALSGSEADYTVLRNYVVSHATAGLPTNDYAPAGAVTSEYS